MPLVICLEGIGGAITKSPVLTGLVKVLGDELTKIATKAANIKLDDIFSVDGIIRFAVGVNNFVIAPLELVGNLAKTLFGGINTIVSGSVALIGQKVGFIADLLNKVGVDNGLTQGLQDFRDTSAQVFTDIALDTQKATGEIFNGTIFGNTEELISKLQTTLQTAADTVRSSDLRNAVKEITSPEDDSLFGSFKSGFGISEFVFDAETKLGNFAEKTKQLGTQVRSNLIAGIGNGAGQAFAAFGQAIASGENGLEAFAKAFLATVAQTAIQVGTSFILTGVGYSFLGDPRGAGLIGAGAALAAFGGALAAFSGGGKGASAGVGAGGGSIISGEEIIDPRSNLPASSERLEPNTAVTVNIQGDVFDSEETGLRISNILRDASLNQNVRASVFA
jgi:hypothetical protein